MCPVSSGRSWYEISSLKKGQVPMDSISDKPIVYLASSWEIGGEIVRALGLRDVVEFSLVFKGGAPVQVVAVHDVREADGETILQKLTTRRYRLMDALATPQDLRAQIDALQAELLEMEVAQRRDPSRPSPHAGADIDRRAPAGEG
jgi:hypothetical protein